jgi:hypothetical protein
MPLTHDKIKAAITEASVAMDLDPSLKGTVAAHEFSANYTKLIAHRRGRPTLNTRSRHNKKLTIPQKGCSKRVFTLLTCFKNLSEPRSPNSCFESHLVLSHL